MSGSSITEDHVIGSLKLRQAFSRLENQSWVNAEGEPDLGYVLWLETLASDQSALLANLRNDPLLIMRAQQVWAADALLKKVHGPGVALG